MRRALGALGVAVATSGFAAAGCAASPEPQPPSTTAMTAPSVPVPAAPAELPGPEALADVLYRLADPGVPGSDKLVLVEEATASDAAMLDGFAAALRDGGFTPVTVTATDIRWSDTAPSDVLATVTISGPEPDPGEEFRFPLEFRPHDGGWQLTKDTAQQLLLPQ